MPEHIVTTADDAQMGLWGIHKRYGVGWNEIKEANSHLAGRIPPYGINPGDVINIPDTAPRELIPIVDGPVPQTFNFDDELIDDELTIDSPEPEVSTGQQEAPEPPPVEETPPSETDTDFQRTNDTICSADWFVTKDPHYQVRSNNHVQPLINGEITFRAVAKAIQNAKHSVSIASWGISTNMPLIREGSDKEATRIDTLLTKKGAEGVKVRVMIWELSAVEPNISDHDHFWYKSRTGQVPNVDFMMRKYNGTRPSAWNTSYLRKMKERPKSAQLDFMYQFAYTHHQKLIVIDIEDPKNAVGFVMGHNLKHAYWDTNDHLEKNNQRFYVDGKTLLPPWEDISSRVTGPVLIDLYQNYRQGWNDSIDDEAVPNLLVAPALRAGMGKGENAELHKLEIDKYTGKIQAIVNGSNPEIIAPFQSAYALLDNFDIVIQAVLDASETSQNIGNDFTPLKAMPAISTNAVPFEQTSKQAPLLTAQITRTFNKTKEISVLNMYDKVIRKSRHFIYIEDQYFRYNPIPQAIVDQYEKMDEEGHKLYVIIVTNRLSDGDKNNRSFDKISEKLAEKPTYDSYKILEKAGVPFKFCYLAQLQPSGYINKNEKHPPDLVKTADTIVGFLYAMQPEQRQQVITLSKQLKPRLASFKYLIKAFQRHPRKLAFVLNTHNALSSALGTITTTMEEIFNIQIYSQFIEDTKEGFVAQTIDYMTSAGASTPASQQTMLKNLDIIIEKMAIIEKGLMGLDILNPARLIPDWEWLKGKPKTVEQVRKFNEAAIKELEDAIAQFKKNSKVSHKWTIKGLQEVHKYYIPNRDIYVHSKIMIVDNAFYIIGSANINERSMLHDTEIAIGVRSCKDYPAAKNFRQELWGKSLKVTMPAGLDFPKTAKDWEEVYKKWEKELKFNQEDFINGQTLNSHPRTFKPADRPTGDATLS